MKKPAALILFALALAACGQSSASTVRTDRTVAHTAPLSAHRAATSPTYTYCLWTGNSITNGADLASPYTSPYEGYFVPAVQAQRNANDCSSSKYHGVSGNGWCAADALANMQSTGYHPAVDLAIVQFGENEFRNGGPSGPGCQRTPAQFGTDLAALLAYMHATSPNATLVCTTVWFPLTQTNVLGYAVSDYNAVTAATCAGAGYPAEHLIDITSLYPTSIYRGVNMCCGDTYHPDMWGNVAIAQRIVDALP